MASDEKQPAKNFASNGLILAVLIVTGTAVYTHRAPLQGARPPITETPIHQEAAMEDVEARLWQDPFGAVAKQYNDQLAKEASGKSGGSEDPCADAHCTSPLLQHPNDKTLVLAVTVPGAPYADIVEWRRRARYAVVSALGIARFKPEIEDHIGFFRPVTCPSAGGAPSEEAESVSSIPRHSGLAGSVALKTSGKNKANREAARPKAMAEGRSTYKSTSDNKGGSCSAGTAPPWVHTVVPYEWFSKDHPSDPLARILVLWINEDVLGDQPLQTLSSLVKDLCSPRPNSTNNTCPPGAVTIKFLGPHASTTLRAMVEEVSISTDCQAISSKLGGATFYAYATVGGQELLGVSSNNGVTDSVRKLRNGCIDLIRTIATDDVLAQDIVKELQRRGVDPLATRGPNQQHIALISESDTLYGRNFPNTMERAFTDDSAPQPGWLHNFSYLRGLDGQTAQAAEGKQDKRSAASPEKDFSVVDLINADVKDDAKASDRPDGQGQFDYLRRTADDLVSLNDRLGADGKGSIKAIGIVGSDVFDKLLVLRALRPEFPDALFFTTDLDATLTMPSERDWTRNLIVASSFGLELHPDIQKGIPPFRSNYETSAFLAARLAIRDFQSNKSPQKEDLEPRLSKWLAQARIFEITRTGGVLALGRQDESDKNDHPCGDLNDGQVDLMTCSAIHPRVPPLYHRLPPESGILIGCTLLGSALLLLSTLFNRDVRKAGLPLILVTAFVGISGAASSVWWREIAGRLTNLGDGEPLTLQGASFWPTILLRALGVILSISLIWQGLRRGNENLKIDVASYLKLPRPSNVNEEMTEKDRRRPWGKNFALMFSYRLAEDQPNRRGRNNERYDLEKAWSRYVYSGRLKALSARAFVFVVGMLILYYMLSNIFWHHTVLARNEYVRLAYNLMTFFDIVFLQLLIFFVLDTTLLCLSLVSQFAKQHTRWHMTTRTHYASRLGLERYNGDDQIVSVVDDWIDLTFVERRTRCINQFIFYPFIVIALLLVSRSTLFANYPPDAPLLITTGISLIIAFGCALALPHAAEKARDFAKRDITAAIVRSKGFEDGRLAEQLEALLNRVNSLHEGAFSPCSQQPFVRALLLPLSTLGGTALLEFLALPGA